MLRIISKLLIMLAGIVAMICSCVDNDQLINPYGPSPEQVTDLAVVDSSPFSITLSWTAPGADGSSGKAQVYDIRYAAVSPAEFDWDSAIECADEPVPQLAGTVQSFEVAGLSQSMSYTFSIRAANESNNWSYPSSPVTAETRPFFVASDTIGSFMWARDICAADLNGDNNVDLAVAHGNGVTVFINTGSGFSTEGVNYLAGSQPYSLAAVDLDGDNDLDLACANAESKNVSILINNGDGSFQSSVNYDVGYYPVSITANDFDGDDDIDLAVSIYQNGGLQVSVIFNQGNGTYSGYTPYSTGGVATHNICSSDFDNDGDCDLAVSNAFTHNIAILPNEGTGIFAGAIKYSMNGTPTYIATADFNMDGNNDLVVGMLCDSIYLYLNNGAGAFERVSGCPTGDDPVNITINDFNGDGLMDLATANEVPGDLFVLLNSGNMAMVPAAAMSVSGRRQSITSADFDNDGDADLALVIYDYGNGIVIYENLMID